MDLFCTFLPEKNIQILLPERAHSHPTELSHSHPTELSHSYLGELSHSYPRELSHSYPSHSYLCNVLNVLVVLPVTVKHVALPASTFTLAVWAQVNSDSGGKAALEMMFVSNREAHRSPDALRNTLETSLKCSSATQTSKLGMPFWGQEAVISVKSLK